MENAVMNIYFRSDTEKQNCFIIYLKTEMTEIEKIEIECQIVIQKMAHWIYIAARNVEHMHFL